LIKNIIFDFDGVISDSISVKTEAFKKLFENFDKKSVGKLIEYHLVNGGKSRYLKIKYFFEELLNKNISDDEILEYADKYSYLTKEELSKKQYLILDTFDFIKKNHRNYNMHIASGADENDLKYICHSLKLDKYFLSINGSPKIKHLIVSDILLSNCYSLKETILIGDSINDYEAAKINNIDFFAFNNVALKEDHRYIETFLDF